MIYRKLTNLEVELLMNQGCRSDDWGLVEVADGFAPDRVYDTTFSGHVRLGVFAGDILSEGEIRLPAGIYRACIVSCTIGTDVRIAGVRRFLANCCIGDRVVISDVGAVYATAGRQVVIGDDARVMACGTLTDLQIGSGVELCHVEQLHRLALSALDAPCPQPESELEVLPDAASLPTEMSGMPGASEIPETSAGLAGMAAPVATEWDFMPEDDVDVFPAAAEEPAAASEAVSSLQPEPVLEPEPAPEPEPLPGPEPEPVPASAPAPESEPVPVSVSEPEAGLVPESEPIPEAELVPAPVPEPSLELEPELEPAPAPSPAEHILPQQGSLFDEWTSPSPSPVLADTLQLGYSPLNDLYAGVMPIAHTLQARKVARMADAIGLNDRFLFTRELFKSNPQWYKECLEQIDACTSRKEAETFVREKYGWKKTLPAAKKFYSIIERRFSENE